MGTEGSRMTFLASAGCRHCPALDRGQRSLCSPSELQQMLMTAKAHAPMKPSDWIRRLINALGICLLKLRGYFLSMMLGILSLNAPKQKKKLSKQNCCIQGNYRSRS